MSSTPSFAPERFHRHAFVWFDPPAQDASASPEANAALCDWLADGYPLIVRRPDAPLSADEIAVGLALPPSQGKLRLAFRLPRALVRAVVPPPVVPQPGETYAALAAAAQSVDLPLRGFGSHAWQSLTGLTYVTPRSDIDLLLFVEDAFTWRQLEPALSAIPLPAGIDLEIVLRRDASFSWRESAARPDRLLFKGATHTWLGAPSDIAHLLA